MMLRKRTILFSLLILLIMVTFVNVNQADADYLNEFGSRVLSRGNEGLDVAVLQQKLKQLNYYNNSLDGLYGDATAAAVKNFQRDNDLKADGVFAEAEFEIIPEFDIYEDYNISRDELILLARVIHGEARGESFKGKIAVGSVIINRVESNQFPNTIRGVVTQRGQFSSLMDGQANYHPTESEIAAARAALLGYDPTRGSIFFYNPDVATNTAWISRRDFVTRIGEHVFLR